jgi:hypothetical protein
MGKRLVCMLVKCTNMDERDRVHPKFSHQNRSLLWSYDIYGFTFLLTACPAGVFSPVWDNLLVVSQNAYPLVSSRGAACFFPCENLGCTRETPLSKNRLIFLFL